MSITITDACINCMACIDECPNTAIYEPDQKWKYSDGTALKGTVTIDNQTIDADQLMEPVSSEFVYIVPGKCTNCVGFHETPQCALACPMDCCVPDINNPETIEESLKKQHLLHNL